MKKPILKGFRPDRFISCFVVHPILKKMSTARGAPILMYHSISDTGQNARPYYQTNTSPKIFHEQMKFLYENGYSVAGLAQLTRDISAGKDIVPKTLVLTFDDGFKDFYTDAFPVLQQFGFTAMVFLATGFIDQGLRFNGQACLSWDEVRELKKYGISFGSHTVTHPVLSMVSKKELEYELVCSKARIESELGEEVESFCYPFAFPEINYAHVESLIAMLAKSGYRCGVSTKIGTASRYDNVFCLKRLPVNSLDDERLFSAKIDGAYDWVHACQVFYKRLRPRKSGMDNSFSMPGRI